MSQTLTKYRLSCSFVVFLSLNITQYCGHDLCLMVTFKPKKKWLYGYINTHTHTHRKALCFLTAEVKIHFPHRLSCSEIIRIKYHIFWLSWDIYGKCQKYCFPSFSLKELGNHIFSIHIFNPKCFPKLLYCLFSVIAFLFSQCQP